MRVRAGTLPALGAGAIAFVIGAYYLSVIAEQGDLSAPRVWLVAGYIFAGGGLTMASLVGSQRRAYWLAAAAGMLTFIGAIGVFTIGAPLLIAGGLATIAAGRAAPAAGASRATALAVALLVVLAGAGGLLTTPP